MLNAVVVGCAVYASLRIFALCIRLIIEGINEDSEQ